MGDTFAGIHFFLGWILSKMFFINTPEKLFFEWVLLQFKEHFKSNAHQAVDRADLGSF